MRIVISRRKHSASTWWSCLLGLQHVEFIVSMSCTHLNTDFIIVCRHVSQIILHAANFRNGDFVCREVSYFCLRSRLGLFLSTINTDRYYRVLTMVYNIQRYWVFGLCPSSGFFLNKWKTQRFENWICFRPQVREDTYSVGSLPSPEDGNRSSFRNVVFFIYLGKIRINTEFRIIIINYTNMKFNCCLPKYMFEVINRKWPFTLHLEVSLSVTFLSYEYLSKLLHPLFALTPLLSELRPSPIRNQYL
jgi:hypothetical protein